MVWYDDDKGKILKKSNALCHTRAATWVTFCSPWNQCEQPGIDSLFMHRDSCIHCAAMSCSTLSLKAWINLQKYSLVWHDCLFHSGRLRKEKNNNPEQCHFKTDHDKYANTDVNSYSPFERAIVTLYWTLIFHYKIHFWFHLTLMLVKLSCLFKCM